MSRHDRRVRRIESNYVPSLPNGGIVVAYHEDAGHVRIGDEVITREELRARYSVRSGWTVVITDPALTNV